jgi:hypothetical protein
MIENVVQGCAYPEKIQQHLSVRALNPAVKNALF